MSRVRVPDLSACRRVLIVKLSALGDVVHALPTAAAIKKSFPHLEVDWVVEPLAAPLLEMCPLLTRIFVAPKKRRVKRFGPEAARDFLLLCRELRGRRYDVALDLQGLTKSAVLAVCSGARNRIGYNWLRELAPMLERRVPRRPESVHVVDQLLDVARHLGAEVRSPEFPMTVPEVDLNTAKEKLMKAGLAPGQRFLVLNPTAGGGGGQKGLTADTMAEVMDAVGRETGIPWVLVGAASDAARAEAVLHQVHVPAFNLVGQTSVRELAAVILLAETHVSGDSGSAHIAAALGTPPVTVYGRSNPARVGPYGYARFVVDARRYCSDRCRRYHERPEVNLPAVCVSRDAVCMSRVTVSDVVPVVLMALEESARRAAGQELGVQ